MARTSNTNSPNSSYDTPVMALGDLVGRVVYSESGERLGVIRALDTDEDGAVTALHVRDRWMLGQGQVVPAVGMHLDSGDVIVRSGSTPSSYVRRGAHGDDDDSAHDMPMRMTYPGTVLVAGREGVRRRFGGLDLLSSLFGALVIIGSLLVIGGILAAAFGTGDLTIDTAMQNADELVTESMIVAGVAALLASFLGGWATGRSARFDGIGNGLMSVVWALAIIAALAGLTAWLGDEYDVLAVGGVPNIVNEDIALWGVLGVLALVAVMLIGAALGGALGESWHRRADRAMLDLVPVDDDERAASTHSGIVGSPVAPQPLVDDTDAVYEQDVPSERRIHE